MAHYYQILAFDATDESQLYIEDQFGNLHTIKAIIAGEVYKNKQTIQGDIVKMKDVVLQSAPEA
jgi:hypothetical protein